tara:strand:+ start:1225 stop:1770 length:546 start_codon:yes stop_codon:yes gene_type:complete
MRYIINDDSNTKIVSIDVYDKKYKNGEKVAIFIEMWKRKYKEKKDFSFIFDTTNITSPDVKDCYKVIKLIREIKKKKIQYLKYSIITINSYSTKNLLFFIFKIQPPVAPVFLVKNKKEAIELSVLLSSNEIDSLIVNTYCEINEVFKIDNVYKDKKMENTIEAFHIIDDSVESLNNLIKEE